MTLLDEIAAKLSGMTPDQLKQVEQEVMGATANKPFIPSPGPQTEAYLSQADILLYGGKPGGGKRLRVDQIVPVPLTTDPSGYKRHGELAVGDYVYSPNGHAVRVLAVHPVEPEPDAYEVHFSTGEVIEADADHNWFTWTRLDRQRDLRCSTEWRANRKKHRPSRAVSDSQKPWVSKSITAINKDRVFDIIGPQPSVKTTADILSTLYKDGRPNHSIDVIAPIDGPQGDLPCDPYLFGLWLGDGFTKAPQIIMMTSDWHTIDKYLPRPAKIVVEGKERRRITEVQIRRFTELSFIRTLKIKRIPSNFLRAGLDQRLELLRGIMDTDGTCDHRGHCEIGFSNRALTEDVLDLLNSLGIKCAMNEKRMRSERHARHFRIKFVTDFTVFKLPRKVLRQKKVAGKQTFRRYITDVRPCAPTPMNCITVEGGLYCVGKTYVATHNTSLLVGLALNEHARSLIVRREFVDLEGVVDNAKGILKTNVGFVGGSRPKYRKPDGGVIHFEGIGSKDGAIDTGKQGNARDFIGVDEAAQLPENSIRTLLGWLRTTDPSQRTRMVLASNPPLDETGDWMVEFFGPWLDKRHPNPARPGELRWFVMDGSGKSLEVDGPEPIEIDGKIRNPHSRTFIPADSADNPYIDHAEYQRKLEIMPEPQRTIMMTGDFMYARVDDANQVIPTEWIRQAMQRWTPQPVGGVPMCAMGVDVAQGGSDNTTIAVRYDGWYGPITKTPGVQTPTGREVAALVFQHRRDNAAVVIDMGGGYGMEAHNILKESLTKPEDPNPVYAYKGASESVKRSANGLLRFANMRSEAYWKLREALDPSQDHGSQVMLPDDPELMADLSSARFVPNDLERGMVTLEPKRILVARLGRSPDKGDAVAMAWSAGATAITHATLWRSSGGKPPARPVKVNLGYANRKKR